MISANLIETFYPLRQDFDRLAVGTYLLGVTEGFIQPGVPAQELFLLLLHTLSRLTFSDQPWKPLVAGFLLHLSACEGFKPRLMHCVHCEKRLTESESIWFDLAEGGLVCRECHLPSHAPVSAAQARWMRTMLNAGSAAWVDAPDCNAPFGLLRKYVESRMDHPVRAADMLPKDTFT